jgi:hypothetical protein
MSGSAGDLILLDKEGLGIGLKCENFKFSRKLSLSRKFSRKIYEIFAKTKNFAKNKRDKLSRKQKNFQPFLGRGAKGFSFQPLLGRGAKGKVPLPATAFFTKLLALADTHVRRTHTVLSPVNYSTVS